MESKQLINDHEIKQIKSLLDHFNDRKERAKNRFSESPSGWWHFALLGFEADFKLSGLQPIATLQAVEEPPGEIELAGALVQPQDFSAVARYSRNIKYELSVAPLDERLGQSAFTLAWWIISAIRVKSAAEFLVPVAADHSWSVISGVPNNTCRVSLIEDVPSARRLEQPVIVTESDVAWVGKYLSAFARLLENPRFRVAVDALTTHQHALSARLMTASIWSGIEALLDVKLELRYRLSLQAAAVLEPQGSSRIKCYRRMKKLYDERSKAVHGGIVSDSDLQKHVVEARKVLQRLLCYMIEHGKVLDEEDFEIALLS